MHELGVVFQVVKTVEKFAQQNQVTTIDTIVLQIGELSSMIPKYVEYCFPAAVDGTFMQDTKLKIEILTANALCTNCQKVYPLFESNKQCPFCESIENEILNGKEFIIKEIVAY